MLTSIGAWLQYSACGCLCGSPPPAVKYGNIADGDIGTAVYLTAAQVAGFTGPNWAAVGCSRGEGEKNCGIRGRGSPTWCRGAGGGGLV